MSRRTTHGWKPKAMANEVIVANVKLVSVYVNKDGFTNVELTLDKSFEGFVAVKDKNGAITGYTKGDVDHFSIGAQELLDLACGDDTASELINMTDTKDRYTQRTIGGVYAGTTIKFEREFKAKGEEVNGKALTRDSYLTTVVKYSPSERAVERMTRMIDKLY